MHTEVDTENTEAENCGSTWDLALLDFNTVNNAFSLNMASPIKTHQTEAASWNSGISARNLRNIGKSQ